SEMGPHEEFLELCAVLTSGDLTEEEQKNLQVHLAGCPECRQALSEFEGAADIGVPLLSSKFSVAPSEESESPQGEFTGPVLWKTAARESGAKEAGVSTNEEKRGFTFSQRNGHGRARLNWSIIWLPFAACVLLTIALGIYSYRMGRNRNSEVVRVISNLSDTRVGALEQQISDAGHEREMLKAQLGERDRVIADLRRHMEEQSASLNDMKATQSNLEQSLQNDEGEKQRMAEERGSFAQ